ncbi:MAG: translation initiation factor IF-2 [Actinomycetota bacterium]|nr:translation initiation factor IF-2 [Actinomycetota bacterium]
MAKQRVYELARDLGLESKAVLERAQELGIEVKTASSGLDDDSAALVRMSYDESAGEEASSDQLRATSPEPEPELEAVGDQLPPEGASSDELSATGSEPEEEAGTDSEVETDEDKVLLVEAGLTTHEFARMIQTRTVLIVQALMEMGEMIPADGTIPTDAIEALGHKFGYDLLVAESDEEPVEVEAKPTHHIVDYEDDPASLKPRPAVVTVMGHVDHGKTQLLDTIRSENVVQGEAGGITQHIGAYQATTRGNPITFIDTPGHEAFTALRARGANVTDLVILVVAANDGVMPQTVEAIDHAQAAEVPIIVAINKMDLETADPYAVRGALTQHGIVVEELGGDVPAVEVSALNGTGVDDLLEIVGLVAEVEELTANPNAPAVGTVIEAQLEVGRGPVATLIVQRGTLKKGDALACGSVSGRVRAMFDERGNQLKSAGPSAPVLVSGWGDVPLAGDMFQVVKNERAARKMAEAETARKRSEELTVPTATERLTQLLETLRTAEHAELRIIVKADAHGSLEAIREAVGKIGREDASVSIVHGAVGGITANDVMLAEASEAVIYGFNSRPDASARNAAKEAGIEIRTFAIIYELLDDIESMMVGELAPDEVETFLGVAEVRATFSAPRFGLVAGCYVTEGSINRNARARVVRDGVVVHDGRISSLRRFKEDVQHVQVGYECGIGIANFRDVKDGDTIESYEVKEIART